jgi:hypothetical protein
MDNLFHIDHEATVLSQAFFFFVLFVHKTKLHEIELAKKRNRSNRGKKKGVCDFAKSREVLVENAKRRFDVSRH